MKITLTREDLTQIVLEHVRKTMNFDANTVEFDSYSYREDYCVVRREDEQKEGEE